MTRLDWIEALLNSGQGRAAIEQIDGADLRDLVAVARAVTDIANAVTRCPNCGSDYPGVPCPYDCDGGWIATKTAVQMGHRAAAALAPLLREVQP